MYPSADVFAEVATVNRYLSNSENLFNSKVDRIVFPEDDPGSPRWPARYKIILTDRDVRFSDEVILSTGLGEAEYPPQFDEESVRIAKRDSLLAQRENEGDPDLPPGIMTYEDAAEFFTRSLTPLRHFVGKKVDVAGGSDGAATILEELLRLAKRKAYKMDVAQVGTPTKIRWVGQRIKDSRQYKNLLANERYLMLASEMPLSEEDLEKYNEDAKKELDKKLEPVDGYLVQIRDSDEPRKGRYRVTYSMPDKSVRDSYTDFVILAAGYKNKIASLFGKKDNPFENPNEAETVTGELNGIPVPVGVKIKGQAVYGVGPASIGRVLREGELELAGLSGIPASKYLQRVAIATFGPRTEKLGEILGAEEARTLPRLELKKEPLGIRVMGPNSEKIELEKTKEKPQGDRALDDVRLKTLVGKFFEKCEIKGSLPQLSIQFEQGSKDNSVSVSFYPDINKKQDLTGILEDAKVQNLLADSLKGGRWKLIMDIPFAENGDAKISDINIRKESIKK